MTNININNGAFGSDKGVTIKEGGNEVEILIPYYNNNAYGIESTVSQIRLFKLYDLKLMLLPIENGTLESRTKDWYKRMVDGNLDKPALIKMVDDNNVIAGRFKCKYIKADGKNNILHLTRIIN